MKAEKQTATNSRWRPNKSHNGFNPRLPRCLCPSDSLHYGHSCCCFYWNLLLCGATQMLRMRPVCSLWPTKTRHLYKAHKKMFEQPAVPGAWLRFNPETYQIRIPQSPVPSSQSPSPWRPVHAPARTNYICRAYTINKRHMLNIFMLFYCIALKGKPGIEPCPRPRDCESAHVELLDSAARILLCATFNALWWPNDFAGANSAAK